MLVLSPGGPTDRPGHAVVMRACRSPPFVNFLLVAELLDPTSKSVKSATLDLSVRLIEDVDSTVFEHFHPWNLSMESACAIAAEVEMAYPIHVVCHGKVAVVTTGTFIVRTIVAIVAVDLTAIA